jgi:hypothetical protein
MGERMPEMRRRNPEIGVFESKPEFWVEWEPDTPCYRTMQFIYDHRVKDASAKELLNLLYRTFSDPNALCAWLHEPNIHVCLFEETDHGKTPAMVIKEYNFHQVQMVLFQEFYAC